MERPSADETAEVGACNKVPDFIPFYTTEEPNKEIVLRESEEVEVIVEGARYEGNAQVILRFLPQPSLIAHASFPNLAADLYNMRDDPVLLRFPSLGAETEVLPKSISAAPGTPTPLQITLTPIRDSITIGDSKVRTLRVVKFHVVNFCDFHSDPHNDSGNRIVESKSGKRWHSQVLGCATLVADGWRITISALPSTGDLVKALEEAGGYAITHVGVIEHVDGEAFNGGDAADLLDALHFFLSFARGFWTPPVLPIGLSQDGERVWEQWIIGRADSRMYWPSWFDERNGQLLAEVFPGFCRLWRSDIWHWAVREALQWYLWSNTNPGDAGIILTQAALELLAWTFAVKDRKFVGADAFRRLTAADKLRRILSSLNIPIAIPTELNLLASHAKKFNWLDGPQAFAHMRNETVHPHKKRRELADIYDGWKLGQWYVELILLALCGHVGKYSKRLGIQRRGTVIPVPWAT